MRQSAAGPMRAQAGPRGRVGLLIGLLVASPYLWQAPVLAQAEDGWITDKNGCKIANPSPKPGEMVTWSGACSDGFAQGKGIMQWYEDGKPGVRYAGSLVRGMPSGQGRLTMPDGATYEGGWLEGKQSGSGKYAAPGGTSYEGEWKDGAPEGRGVMHGASGEVMNGIWKAGTYLGPAAEQ